MNPVRDKIVKLQKEGKTKEQIYTQLIAEGYPVDMITIAFTTQATSKQAPTGAPLTMPPVSSTSSEAVPVDSDEHKSKATNIILTTGAILIAAGIFSFVATNWQEMTDVVKVILIIAGILIFNISGWYIRNNTSLTKTGTSLLFLGSLTYGAGLFLVAQIFNIRAEWPDGFMLWALGTLLFAYITHAASLYVLTVAVAVIGIFGYATEVAFNIFRDSVSLSPHYISDVIMYVTTIACVVVGLLLLKKAAPETREFY